MPYERPPLSRELAAPLPQLPEPKSDDWDDIGEAYLQTIMLYGECTRTNSKLVELWGE